MTTTNQSSESAQDTEGQANARLIAAAPDLYSSLSAIMQLMSDNVLVRNTQEDHADNWALRQLPLVMALKNANAALLKAKGQP